MRALVLVALLGCGVERRDEPPNYAFVTSMQVAPSAIGSLAHADDICNAAGRNLGGHYVAWLSTQKISAASRLRGANGWILPNGTPVADTLDHLISNGPWYAVQFDENGTRLPWTQVATGTRYDGTPVTDGTCGDYTQPRPPDGSIAANLGIGWTDHTRRQWTEYGVLACEVANLDVSLYCFGNDRSARVDAPVGGDRVAFVSSGSFNPKDGIDAADQLCMQEAAINGLPGTFRALMATSQASAASRFDSGPWWRVDGVQFSADLAAIDAPLDVRADGSIARAMTFVWTGADDFTHAGTGTCHDWAPTASTDLGLGADVKSTMPGIGSTGFSCSSEQPVYCLQL